MIADSWTWSASLLCSDALGFCAKTPPGHHALSPRTGGDVGKLDEGKTARAALAGGSLLRHHHRPAGAHAARNYPRRRPALALARAGDAIESDILERLVEITLRTEDVL